MYCKYCGNQLLDDAKFCDKCGRSIQEVETTTVDDKDIGKPPFRRKCVLIPLIALPLLAVAVLCGALISKLWLGKAESTVGTVNSAVSDGVSSSGGKEESADVVKGTVSECLSSSSVTAESAADVAGEGRYDTCGFISAGYQCSSAVKADGTVVFTGQMPYSFNLSDWTDIAAVASGVGYVAGLKSDGTVVLKGGNSVLDSSSVSDWTDITVLSGDILLAGLKRDGTVRVAGVGQGSLDVSGWTDIVDISVSSNYLAGVKVDGTVLVAINEGYFKSPSFAEELSHTDMWTDIVKVSAGPEHLVGLKSDGSVVAVGNREYTYVDLSDADYDMTDAPEKLETDVLEWEDIISVAAGSTFTAGLKANGTLVVLGAGDFSSVAPWTGIVAISASDHILGLRYDGTVVAAGDNTAGECAVEDWSGIALPKWRNPDWYKKFTGPTLKTDLVFDEIFSLTYQEFIKGEYTDISGDHMYLNTTRFGPNIQFFYVPFDGKGYEDASVYPRQVIVPLSMVFPDLAGLTVDEIERLYPNRQFIPEQYTDDPAYYMTFYEDGYLFSISLSEKELTGQAALSGESTFVHVAHSSARPDFFAGNYTLYELGY